MSTTALPMLLRWSDVASVLGVSRSQAFALMRRMPHVRIGRSIRVERVDFEAWLDGQKQKGE
jgi:excisionase family DNA binding protein